jgi:hypothetical protein
MNDMTKIDETLSERGGRYGKYKDHAYITQNIKRAMMDSKNWGTLSDDKRESLEMIAHKIGRILNGDPEYIENFRDISGYAELVRKTLQETEGATDAQVTQVRRISGEWKPI